MKLYICEKPSQGRDLARNLGVSGTGDGFIGNQSIAVTWAVGHLVQQLEPDEIDPQYSKWKTEHLPIVPKVWNMKPNLKTKKQLNVVKGLLKRSNHVVIATDGDREGEVIGRELLDYFNWSGRIYRLWLTALDDASIQVALKNLKQSAQTKSLYDAGLARARADWLVGMNTTRALSIKAQQQGYQGVLSVGRVQTPTLAIVVNRDIEIENFKPKDYYDITGVFNGIKAKWITPDDITTNFDDNRCLNLDFANQIADKVRNGNAKVTIFETKRKKVSPPLLYSLSALQQAASKKFGFGAKQVLDIAQSLYEKHKATTYPRSDCQYLPLSQLSEAKDVVSALSGIGGDIRSLINGIDLTIQSKVWNDKKQGAHHAIIPTTNKQVNVSNMNTDEVNLYKLICSSYIAQFYPDYEYDQTSIEINASNEIFSSSINVDINLGWKVVTDPQTKLKQNTVPKIEQGQALSIDAVDIEVKQTKPPARYNEGTLIAAMEKAHLFVTDPNLKKVLKGNEGIGTEATRANIIDLLKKRNFLTVKKKQVISSDTGRSLISAVPSAVKDPGMTAIMESSLSKIESGELTLDAFMSWQVDWLEKLIGSIKSQTISIESNIKTVECPECGNQLRRIKGKKGWFWACKGYFDTPKCKFVAKDKAGKPVM